MNAFHCRRWQFPIPRRAVVMLGMLVALACGAPVAFCGQIHDAARDGDLTKVQALLKDNPALVSSKDNSGGTPLHWAAGNGHKDVVELLLANRADANAKDAAGGTPLDYAAEAGQKGVAELLLANRAQVDGRDNGGATGLFYAAKCGKKDAAELVLANKANVNARNNCRFFLTRCQAFS